MSFFKHGGSTNGADSRAYATQTFCPSAAPPAFPGGNTKSPWWASGMGMLTSRQNRPGAYTMTASTMMWPGAGQGAVEAKKDKLEPEELDEASEALKGWAKLRGAGMVGPYWGTTDDDLTAIQLSGDPTQMGDRKAKAKALRRIADALEDLANGARVWIIYEKP